MGNESSHASQRYTAMKRCRLKRCNFQIKNDMSKETETSDKQQNGNDFIADVRQRYLVSDVIFVVIKDGKITDKHGNEISADFILKHEHYLGKGWGYVIL